MDTFQISRERMVREQIIARKISDPNVLEAMKIVPRHLFVEEAFHSQAYRDHPIPIGYGQTISQPYVVAYMSELLEATPGMKVLEIGTGSGYQSAVLDTMGLEVYSVERLRELYMKTSTLLMRLRYHSIRLKLADGTEGWEESAPYDRIIVTAGGPTIPTPLIDQLADPGIMIVPVGHEKKGQHLVRVKKSKDIVTSEVLIPISFVDLVGSYGW